MVDDESAVGAVSQDRIAYAGGNWCDDCDSAAGVVDRYCRYCGNRLREDGGR